MAAAEEEKAVMVVGVDESEHSMYALQWTIDHFFLPFSSHGVNPPFKLVVVHAEPSPASAAGLDGPGAVEVVSILEAELKSAAASIMERAKSICLEKSVHDVVTEAMEGDARNVLCNSVDKHHASVLVVGSHGYGVIKRAVLGSVSDYCLHHAHCTVTIVKNPKSKR